MGGPPVGRWARHGARPLHNTAQGRTPSTTYSWPACLHSVDDHKAPPQAMHAQVLPAAITRGMQSKAVSGVTSDSRSGT